MFPMSFIHLVPLRISLLFCVVSIGSAVAQEVLPLETLLQRAAAQSEQAQSIELSVRSAVADVASRDFELSPRLTTELAQVEDRRATFNLGRRSLSRLVDINLVKPFSTGTSVALGTGYEVADVASVDGRRHIANWELTLSQSLWRNAFGRNTGLRRDADAAELTSRRIELLQKKQQFMVDLEGAYWDLSLALKELEIREENLKQSVQLEKWIKRRLRNSAAERVDQYQIDALIATHRVALSNVRTRIASLWNRFRQVLPDAKAGAWQPDLKAFEAQRNLSDLLAEREGDAAPERLDALSSRYRLAQTRALAEKMADALRPQFDLVVTHGRNGIESQFGDAWQRTVQSDNTYTKFGVQFAMELDGSTKEARYQALQLEAEARELDSRRLARESQVGWNDLKERVKNLNESLFNARALATSQAQKIREERKRYEQGRSTAFQMISFEVAAAEADLDVYRLFNELRKAESQARFYVQKKEGA